MQWKMTMAVLVSFFWVAGCAVGPDFKSPAPPEATGYTASALPSKTAAASVAGGGAQRFLMGDKIPEKWWTLFHSEGLDRLIRRALADNPTTAAAQAALRQAREVLRAQSAATWFPGVDAKLSAGRERFGAASFGQGSGGGSSFGASRFDLFNASVSVSYLLDVFGGARRELEALQAQVDYERYQLQGTYLTLAANIVTSAVREASLRAQLKATKDILADQEKAYHLVQRQFELGGISRADVLAQRAELAQTRASLPPLKKALSQTRHLLAVLVGTFPDNAGTLPEFHMGQIVLPESLPVRLPSSLVRHRPDIRAAEALFHAAGAQVGVATANLYPSITLTAGYGFENNQIGDLFNGNSVIWNFGAGLLQPLFHGGELRAKRRAAVAAYDQAAALYRETVLQAFLQVADTLRALASDASTLEAQFDAERAADDTLALTRKQFQVGAVSYLSLLDAQRQYQQARIRLIQARAARFADTAALFQAVGGSTWHTGQETEKKPERKGADRLKSNKGA
jgi:NodT family efflux transporter outer membrane factor (OMF) lipoprotein